MTESSLQGSNEGFATNFANPKQLEAINHVDGPLLIIAGPGSGKTFTLVERVCSLIQNHEAEPESLLIVTFTEKAARELRTRISNRLIELGIDFNLNEMYLGTFHSICLRILEEHREFTRLKRSFALMDQFDQQYFFYQNLRDFKDIPDVELVIGEDRIGRWNQSSRLMKWVNKVSEEALDINVLLKAKDAEMQVLGECYKKYQELLEINNSLDFSGIQHETLRLLRSHPEVKKSLQDKLSFLMVDEYQDTNAIQEKILLELVDEKKNLCVVGDDDQGLYRFRGATIRNILEFPELFPGQDCKQVSLTINYRSHPDIVDCYNDWMDQQDWNHKGKRFRYDKNIQAQSKDFPEVPAALHLIAKEEDEENWKEQILTFLMKLKESGKLLDWNQVAFLFKSVKNQKVISLAHFLEKKGIPVYSPRSNLFFQREEIRLMIGALIFLFPQFSKVRQSSGNYQLAVWEYYDQECFKPFTDELRKPENKNLLEWARPLAKKHINLTSNTNYAFSGLFYQLIRFDLFSQCFSDDKLNGIDKGRAARNLATFSKLLSKVEYLHRIDVFSPQYIDKSLRDLFNNFLRFLYEGGIDEYEDESEYAPKGCVSFLTIHQSKGLEFPVVICGSMEQRPIKQWNELDVAFEQYLDKPPFEPIDQTKFYDFRRLFYTAFSRAQNLLVLATQEASGTWAAPSSHLHDTFYRLPSWEHEAFKPEEMEFEPIREINIKNEYSFTSHITLFENCAEQYRFYKELEFAPIRAGAQLFGTLVHQTIEDIHKAVLRGEQSKINIELIEAWFSTNYHYVTKRERQYLAESTQKAALNQVLRYYDREAKNFDRLKEAEVDISLVKDTYILKGSVDLIRGEDNTVEVIDFKSEQKPDMEKDRGKLVQYQRQLEVYAHLIEQRIGQQVSKMHLYYTGEDAGNPYVSFDKDDKSIDKTIEGFDQIVSRIEKKDYEIEERPAKLCVNCDMRAYCDNKNWNF